MTDLLRGFEEKEEEDKDQFERAEEEPEEMVLNPNAPKKPKFPKTSFEEQLLGTKGDEKPTTNTEPKPKMKKIRTKNPGFRPLKINVNKINSSTASRTPIVQPPIISPKADGPLTEKDRTAVDAKVKPPFPKLKAFSTAATVLSYAGYEDEVLSILK